MRKFTFVTLAALMAATLTFAQGNLRSQLTAPQGIQMNQRAAQRDMTAQQRHQMMMGQKPAATAKAPRRAGIEEQPEGTAYELFASYSGLFYNWLYGWTDATTDAGKMTIVEGTDGNIYIQGLTPYAGLDVYYWVKAERAEGDTVVIRQQPTGYYEDYYGGVHEYEIARIAYEYDEATEAENIHRADNPDIKMLYKGNGVLENIDEMKAEAGGVPPYIYGSVYWYEAEEDDDYESGYHTNNEYYWNLSTKINDEKYFEPSADATIEQMIVTYKNVNSLSSKMIDVAFEDDAVYLKLYTRTPGWVKGRIEGDKVVVDNQQYLGYDEYYGTFEWAHTATVETLLDDSDAENPRYYDYGTITDQTVFDYNAETREMSTTAAIYIDGKRYAIYYAAYFNEINIKYFVETPAVPADPEIDYWWEYDESFENAELDYHINATGVNGEYLLPEKLSFMVYVDNEPFVFETAEYEDLEEDLEEIPYGTSVYGIRSDDYLLLFFQPAENVGLQTIYRGCDVEMRSNIVWYDVNTGETTTEPYDNITVGIEGITEHRSDVSRVFDLQGRSVKAGARGLLLMNRDGKMVKVVRK